MTTTRDFHIFKGEREWHIADKNNNLLFSTGSKTLKVAQRILSKHLKGQSFWIERDEPGSYSIYVDRPKQYAEFAGKTIDYIGGIHYGNTPMSLVIYFTDGSSIKISPNSTDFGHGDMASTLWVDTSKS